MGRIVDLTANAAAEWQRDVVRMRMNAAYIAAELPQAGDDSGDIEALSRGFDAAFALFCEEELALFVAARRVETEDVTAAALIAKLHALADSFEPWLAKFHETVVRRRESGDGGLALALLHTCGAELLEANRRFAATIESCAGQLSGS